MAECIYGSFIEGTTITKIDGTEVPIEKIQRGDLLHGIGPEGEANVSQVTGTYKSVKDHYLKITTDHTVLNVSKLHRLYVGPDVPSDKECPHFVQASTLKQGDFLFVRNFGKSKVASIEDVYGEIDVYNLKCERPGVEPTHEDEDCWATFHASGVAVHEMGVIPPLYLTSISPRCGDKGTIVTITCDPNPLYTHFDGSPGNPMTVSQVGFGPYKALSFTQGSTSIQATAPTVFNTRVIGVTLNSSLSGTPNPAGATDYTGCVCPDLVTAYIVDPTFGACPGRIYTLPNTTPDTEWQQINACGTLTATWNIAGVDLGVAKPQFQLTGETNFIYNILDPLSRCNVFKLYRSDDSGGYAVVNMCGTCGSGGVGFGFGPNFAWHSRHDTGGPHSGPVIGHPLGSSGSISHGTPINRWTTTKGIGMRRRYILGAAMLEGSPCTYMYSNTFGDMQFFTADPTPACPTGPTVINFVTQEIVAKKDNSDPRSIVPVLKIGGNIYYGNTYTLTTSFQTFDYVWPTNPATGLAWTLADVNSIEFGVEVT